MTTKSHETLLQELAVIGQRIKRSVDNDQLRKVLVMLNTFSVELPRGNSQTRATYLFYRGVVFTKGARASTRGGWVSSSVESLQYALELFVDADAIFEELTPSRELIELRRSCVYEAMVAVTTLLGWGVTPAVIPDTNCLYLAEQKIVARHQKQGYQLRSRY